MSDTTFSREEIENAMDRYDEYLKSGKRKHSDVFKGYKKPKRYWVRSTKERSGQVYPDKPIEQIYPTKAIVAGILGKTKDWSGWLSGGWTKRRDAAARLHNSGFIIVSEGNMPIPGHEEHGHLIRDVDRIRLCALNYHIEPARERGKQKVSIRANDLAKGMGLANRFPSICSALGGGMLQELANVPPPTYTEPNPSSSTTFTYKLGKTGGGPTSSGSGGGGKSRAGSEAAQHDDEIVGVEGQPICREHLVRERNTGLVKAKKRQAQAAGKLVCEACGFDFAKTYGKRGDGFIECHHLVPISKLSPNSETRLDDLALVCANCHRMIHRKKRLLEIKELKRIIERNAP